MRLASIIGHAPVVALLRQAVDRGRVPHTLLFAGPDGVGKRTTAVALAQALNCPVRRRNKADDACGQCPACQRIARGQHADVTMLDRGDDASIRLKTLRERVLDVIGYRPFEGDRRVFIIDADDLREDGQDALLKTLEEPPPSTVIVLIAAYPDALSPTVQSRCRRLRFGLLSERDVARILVEQAGLDQATARALAAASGGSVSRALAERSGDLAGDRDAALAVLAAARGRVGERLRAAAALVRHDTRRRDREALAARLDVMASLVRDLAALAAGAPGALDHADLETDLRGLSPAYPLPRVAAAYAALGRAQSAIDRNASPKIVADWLAVAL